MRWFGLLLGVVMLVAAGHSVQADSDTPSRPDPLCLMVDGGILAPEGEVRKYFVLLHCHDEPGPIMRLVSEEFYAWAQGHYHDSLVLKSRVR